jgi:hypothetical protein
LTLVLEDVVASKTKQTSSLAKDRCPSIPYPTLVGILANLSMPRSKPSNEPSLKPFFKAVSSAIVPAIIITFANAFEAVETKQRLDLNQGPSHIFEAVSPAIAAAVIRTFTNA